MDKEQSVKLNNAERSGGFGFADVLNVLRANWLLIFIITAIFAVGGYFYAKMRIPVYTASVPVQFEVEIKAKSTKTGEGEGEYDVDNYASASYLFSYLETARPFCKSGEVLDRANVYYAIYLKEVKNGTVKDENGKARIDVFIDKLDEAYNEETKANHEEIEGYKVTDELKTTYRDRWFNLSNVGTTYNTLNNKTVTTFKLWVKNLNEQTAKEMVRIYSLAADVALNTYADFGFEDTKATAGIVELNNSVSGVTSYSDATSKSKTLIISALIGFIISCVVIYIKYLSDNTVKSKEQLEEIMGANVIAYIDDVAEAR